MTDTTMRSIPAVHRFLSEPRIAAYEALLGKPLVKQVVAQTLDGVRRGSGRVPAFEELAAGVVDRLRRCEFDTLVPVINGTGVLLHTNLGRAPLARAALDEIARDGAGYTNLEYDLAQGERGSRYDRTTDLLRQVTGAEAAIVVNNCAAAVLLILDTFAKGREVVVSRGELIEIGGGFRLPDVLERSGARLVEAGATNKTYVRDFERALSAQTALLLRSHRSNYRIEGFTHEADPKELAALGRRAGVPVAEDLGSGALVDLAQFGLPHERTVREAVEDGIDLVAFSGDKLLGGPQAGIIAGKAAHVARLRANPLLRALRVDKTTLAALAATLRLYAAQRFDEIPFFAMLGASIESLRARAARYVDTFPGMSIVESVAYAGGGVLPQSGVASIAIAPPLRDGAQSEAARLRRSSPPVIGRIEGDRLLLDLRTIPPDEDDAVIEALRAGGT